MPTQQKERKFQAADRYATSLFYGGQPERHDSRSAFGATYSNGQARPVTSFAPANRPVARPEAPQPQAAPTVPFNSGNATDGVQFSVELRDSHNGSSLNSAPQAPREVGRGNSGGPLYSNDFRSALDSLLGAF